MLFALLIPLTFFFQAMYLLHQMIVMEHKENPVSQRRIRISSIILIMAATLQLLRLKQQFTLHLNKKCAIHKGPFL